MASLFWSLRSFYSKDILGKHILLKHDYCHTNLQIAFILYDSIRDIHSRFMPQADGLKIKSFSFCADL